MMYELRLRPRAALEIREIFEEYAPLGHERSFLTQLELIFEALRAMPKRFPSVTEHVHRALLRRYPYAVFFRIRSEPVVIVVAVLHQRRDPASWPQR